MLYLINEEAGEVIDPRVKHRRRCGPADVVASRRGPVDLPCWADDRRQIRTVDNRDGVTVACRNDRLAILPVQSRRCDAALRAPGSRHPGEPRERRFQARFSSGQVALHVFSRRVVTSGRAQRISSYRHVCRPGEVLVSLQSAFKERFRWHIRLQYGFNHP